MRSETNTRYTQNHGQQDVEGHQQNFDKLIESIISIEESAVSSEPAASQTDPDRTKLGKLIDEHAVSIEFAAKEKIGRLFLELATHSALLKKDAVFNALENLFHHFARLVKKNPESFDDAWLQETAIEKVYGAIPAESNARNHLLAALASMNGRHALKTFAELIADDPPADERGVLIGFSPLIKSHRQFDVDLLFPKLLEALRFKHLAAIILDLANYTVRRKLTSVHPAKPRVQQLTVLLGQVVSQLALIEEGKIDGKSAQEISQSVNESVALIVSLCDALALARHIDAIGKVRQAMALKHRRVKTEAAAALIRLGDTDDKEGEKQLVALAAEPICRLRVLEYSSELGLLGDIEPRFQDESSRAESELALWLAAPGQMGVAPTSLERVHHCQLRWPGFDDLVKCYLFRFEYRFAGQTYSNIGIVGPLTHAFACNLEHLSPQQILAAFAGWQTEHEDIYTVEIERARQALPGVTETLSRRLTSEFDQAEEAFVGFFFETPVLLATVAPSNPDEMPLVVALDRDHVYPFPSGSVHSPVTAEIGFEIYKGEQVLNSFNEPDAFENQGVPDQ